MILFKILAFFSLSKEESKFWKKSRKFKRNTIFTTDFDLSIGKNFESLLWSLTPVFIFVLFNLENVFKSYVRNVNYNDKRFQLRFRSFIWVIFFPEE